MIQLMFYAEVDNYEELVCMMYAPAVPRVGDHVEMQDNRDMTVVTGWVRAVYWKFDIEQGLPPYERSVVHVWLGSKDGG